MTIPRQMLIVAAIQFLIGLTIVNHALADDMAATLSASQLKFGGRIFDFRADVTEHRPRDTYVPYIKLNSVDWIKSFLKSRPETSNVVFEIQSRNHPVLDHWQPLKDLNKFPIRSGFPEAYQVDGYLTFSKSTKLMDVLFFKEGHASDFYAICGGSGRPYPVFCRLRVTYPPDPNIVLHGSIYGPKKPYEFEKIARILQKIAYCLDVTDRREVASPGLPNANLFEENCKYVPIS